MAKKGLHNSLHIYFSKLKKSPPQLLLSTCNNLKTPSFTGDRGGATLSDAGRILLYNTNDVTGGPTDFSPRFTEPSPDVIKASKRFFVSPVPTNSLIEEARLSAASSSSSRPSDAVTAALPGDGVAVVTASIDPYDDFRQSMQEMVEARRVDPYEPLDWEFMEDLLFCYLELNERSVHEYILRAVTDLTETLRRQIPAARRRKVREGEVV